MNRARVLELLRRHGWNATSFQVLEPTFRYWSDAEDDACVAYFETAGAWVAAGAPIASEERLPAVALGFVNAAKGARRRACFFAVEKRFLAIPGFDTLLIGEQPVWAPNAWEQVLRAKRGLREQIRRARAKGVRVRRVSVAEIEDRHSSAHRGIEALVDAWLRAKPMAPMGFLVDVEPFAHAAERRYFVAQLGEAQVGVLVAVPVYTRGGWLFEDLLRDRRAPNGTTELLVDAAMRCAAAEKSTYVTLGLAPLIGDIAPWLRRARELGAALYDFRGLHAFRARLGPTSWEPIYLAYPAGEVATRALVDVLAAFAHGSFARFGRDTLLRGPAVVVRVLAIALLPWTGVLAMADASQWFPAPWVKPAWIGFDLALCAGLFALARKWRRRLALAITCAIVADAIVTTIETLTFDVRRARGVPEWTILAIACLAPMFAAVVMIGALGHRRTERRPS
jgi:phosphatidylglycerol lysyltransferase